METEVHREIKFDGTNWHVYILGKKVGPNCTKVEATDKLKWLNDGALQDLMDVMCDIVEKAFREEDERKNSKG